MKKPKHIEIVTKFHETFENGQPFTSSEFRMNSIKLTNLKKTVKTYLVSANIETEKSVEQIIWEAIDYAAMKGMKFRSIASLGYGILKESINYWAKREAMIEKIKEEEEKEKEMAEQNKSYEEIGNQNNERLANTRKRILWAEEE